MPTQLQFRRGTTSQNNSFTGAVGELSIDTDTENIRVHDGSQAGGFEIIPAGTIVAFGNTTAPGGWLACNDGAVSRTTFARLFAVIGTTFGIGDGSGNFNVPDLRDRVPLGFGSVMTSMGASTSAIAASAVMNSATKSGVETGTSNTGTSNTGTGNTGTGNTGSTTQSISVGNANFATSAKDSSTASAVNSVNTSGHTHTVPALSIPALSVPALSIPALTVDNFSVATTLPSQVVQYIIKI
tara:strand:+ start:1985 stop:2707 length:723 start_codon:yes stop_codon:yes gene_type:complete